MPPLDSDMSHFAVQDSPIIDHRRDAIDALQDAGAALTYAEEGDRHGNALHYLGRAADHLEAAAAHAPQHRDTLLPLALALYEICDCIGCPSLTDATGIAAAVTAVLAALKTQGEIV